MGQLSTMGRDPFPGGERMLRIWQSKQDLTIQFEDDFKKEWNLYRWISLPVDPVDGGGLGKLTSGNGYALIEASTPTPAGPGVMAANLFASKKKHFNPGLKGVNGVEITLAEFTHSEEYVNKYLTLDGRSTDEEDPYSGLYLMGFVLTIGSPAGFVGTHRDEANHRKVQIHCDLFSKGLHYNLVRNVIPGDEEKYTIYQHDPEKYRAFMRQYGHDAYLEWKLPYISIPAVILGAKSNPFGIANRIEHRMGLWLSDNGNTLSWTLDGSLIDIVDITGFMSSNAQALKDGAYVTIGGTGSYRKNWWKVQDVKIFASE